MEVMDMRTGQRKRVIVSFVEDKDFKYLTKRRFSFHWRTLKGEAAIYKLQLEGEKDILGVMALVDIPEECRVEIKLLANARENIGKDKKFDRVAGCLISYASNLASTKYGDNACVSLMPKTNLIGHYMEKYQMMSGGPQLYLERKPLRKILKNYFYDYP